jgi:hypothetical protein
MKTQSKLIVMILLVFILAACGGNTTSTPEMDVLSLAQTAAAQTLVAQTSTPPATATLFPTALPTLGALPTFVSVSPTLQSVTSYTVSGSTANGCNNAAFVSDVTIADGTILAPSESFTKTWEFQNTGTCYWDEDFLIMFLSGTDMDSETTEIDQDVLTGSTGDISVYLTAPNTEGTYTGYWRMADSDGNAFGESVYVMIVVSGDAATATPTPTSEEEEETATSEPTSTPQPTETLTSTSIPTEIPISTEAESE